MEFAVIKEKNGVFNLYPEFSKEERKVLQSTNHWDALREAEKIYPNVWIEVEIGGYTGDLITYDDYQESVDCDGFTDYDGYGYSYDKDFKFLKNVHPSMKQKPKGAEYVLWFNR